ncbi:hypothetical protein [Virgibacillus sp. YIM 98842]|uniref:helix-turn-helix domain-containing protein n=1 Tax=Virgibacillus sp. YIM 98842 TaxID=2663533 RepID=UPI0013DB7766|nr:hypothetical protein [Virgibacillus sp. YIM 98842]
MVSFAIIISFILHIITFAVIYVLFKQVQTKKETNTGEIQTLLDGYLQEIKEENFRLQKAVSEGWTNEHGQPLPKKDNTDGDPATTNTSEDGIYENEQKDDMEASLQSRILQLYDQGHTEAEIARELNCGKTEAALIIKLYSKK